MSIYRQTNVRQSTNAVLEMVENGLLDPVAALRECLCYMSESDVDDMAHRAGWLEDEENEENEGEEDSAE